MAKVAIGDVVANGVSRHSASRLLRHLKFVFTVELSIAFHASINDVALTTATRRLRCEADPKFNC